MAEAEPTAARRCGFVALLGAPNAGKSTLLNRLVGTKVSIVTAKVQTTRRRILGITVRGAAQLVFVDTPGIFAARPGRPLERAMVRAAWRGAEDADLSVLVVDARRGLDADTRLILDGPPRAPRQGRARDQQARPGGAAHDLAADPASSTRAGGSSGCSSSRR